MQLGRYQILKQLASGSIADVLLARATGLEGFARHVVIKRIRPELASEHKFANAFLGEARIAASLHHQNIIQVHDIGEQGGAYYFAMEYIHGEDARKLFARVRERNVSVPIEHAISIVTATAAGLHYAHEKLNPSTGEPFGLVHRDVSPANILIGYDGSVKIVDFGLARAAQRSTTTATGTLKGKAPYMSPEQCKGHQLDRRTDIFSLGIVLYELVTAQRLFQGATELMTMAAIVEGRIPKPSSLRSDVPPALDEIILRALARSPAARYQTAEALRESLEAFALAQELRTSYKALADYLVGLFGGRPEPWETEAMPAPAVDITHVEGVVTAPEADAQALLARHAPGASSPMVLAGETPPTEWDDDHEQGATIRDAKGLGRSNRNRQNAHSEHPPLPDEIGGSTVIEPPIFDGTLDAAAEAVADADRADADAAAAAAAAAANADNADNDDDDDDEPATELALDEPSYGPQRFDAPVGQRPSGQRAANALTRESIPAPLRPVPRVVMSSAASKSPAHTPGAPRAPSLTSPNESVPASSTAHAAFEVGREPASGRLLGAATPGVLQPSYRSDTNPAITGPPGDDSGDSPPLTTTARLVALANNHRVTVTAATAGLLIGGVLLVSRACGGGSAPPDTAPVEPDSALASEPTPTDAGVPDAAPPAKKPKPGRKRPGSKSR